MSETPNTATQETVTKHAPMGKKEKILLFIIILIISMSIALKKFANINQVLNL